MPSKEHLMVCRKDNWDLRARVPARVVDLLQPCFWEAASSSSMYVEAVIVAVHCNVHAS